MSFWHRWLATSAKWRRAPSRRPSPHRVRPTLEGLEGRIVPIISLTTPGSAYTQNFDTLSNIAGSTTNNLTITGWFLTESGGGARDNEQYAVDTGGSNTGDTYSYGASGSTERALGMLRSGTLIPTIGAAFTNNTGVTLTSLDIAYTGEQWRLGTAARTDQINFEYSLNATDLVTGTWTGVAALDFVTPDTVTTGPKDGNSAADRTTLSAAIPSLSIANGATFWIRWTDLDASGADDGLAVDDFSLTPQIGSGPPTLNVSDVTLAEGDSPGTTTFTFAVTLTSPAGPGGVTFDIATADGTAQDGNPLGEDNDFVAQSLTGQSIPMDSTGPYNFSVTVNRDSTVEPNETFFVNVTNIVGASPGDSQGQGTINNDDVIITPIHDIQGPGASSPIVGSSVTTRGIVTGVRSNGFFLQQPDAEADADPATSEGIFVFTSSAPPAAAAVGNLVTVTATVSEFVPAADPLQPPLTELTSPTVVLVSTGNPLPVPVPLTATFPDPAGVHDQLERLEGMRVSVGSLTVTAPTDGSVNEVNATASSRGVFFGVVTGVPRPFREAGIEAPDPAPPGSTIPPIPRWDHNPELIRVDSDGLVGGPLVDVGTGAVVTGLVGPLDFTLRSYTILPDPGSSLGVSGGPTPTSVAAPATDEFTVASYNLGRFYDTVNDPAVGEPVLTAAAFDQRLNKASLAIRNHLRMPDILAVQEVENLTTLQALAARISADAIAASQPDPQYDAFLIEGSDPGGIDVGFLVKSAPVSGITPRVEVVSVQQELAGTLFVNPDSSTTLLHERPPLRLEAMIHHSNGASFPVTVLNVHPRSVTGIDDPGPGSNGWPTEGDRVRAKRQKQAEDIANLVQARQVADPSERILVVGDFESYEFNDGYVDFLGTVSGTPTPDNETAVPGDGVDLVNPDLVNLLNTAPPAERYTFLFSGSAQSFDHVLANQPVVSSTLARRVEHARINADFPETARNDGTTALRLSAHDPLISYFRVAEFAVADLSLTMTAAPDPVPVGAQLTYTLNFANNGPDPAESVSVSGTLPVGTTFVSASSPGGWSGSTPAVGSGGTVSFDLPTAGNGAMATFTITVAVVANVGTNLSFTATASSAVSDSNPGNHSPMVTVAVVKAATTTSLAPASSTITQGQAGAVVATVAVTAPGAGTPTGSILFTFTGTATSTQTVPLSGLTASPDLSTLAAGTYTVTAEYLGDGAFEASAVSNSVTVTVSPSIAFTTTSLPATTRGIAYLQGLVATGGTGALQFTVSAGALPGGLALSTSGIISGIPTVAGMFTFTVKATDSLGAFATRTFLVTINPPIAFRLPALPPYTIGVFYNQPLTRVTGGTGPIRFRFALSGPLPRGLRLVNGVLRGTPTTATRITIVVTAVDSVGAFSRIAYTLTWNRYVSRRIN